MVMIPVPSPEDWRPEGFLTARQSRRTVLAQEHQVSSWSIQRGIGGCEGVWELVALNMLDSN